MELVFKELEHEVVEAFKRIKNGTLATSFQDKVTARSMSFVSNGTSLFFQTDRNFEKYYQIENNPQVAICMTNIQIEGIAENMGHPLNVMNEFFQMKFKDIHSGSFEKYSHLENEVLFKVNPLKITIWKYIEDEPCRDFIDFQTKIAKRVFYKLN